MWHHQVVNVFAENGRGKFSVVYYDETRKFEETGQADTVDAMKAVIRGRLVQLAAVDAWQEQAKALIGQEMDDLEPAAVEEGDKPSDGIVAYRVARAEYLRWKGLADDEVIDADDARLMEARAAMRAAAKDAGIA